MFVMVIVCVTVIETVCVTVIETVYVLLLKLFMLRYCYCH